MLGVNQWNWAVERARTGSFGPENVVQESSHRLSQLKCWPSPSLQHAVSLIVTQLLELSITKRGLSLWHRSFLQHDPGDQLIFISKIDYYL